MLRRLWKSVHQRVFPSAAAETIGRTKLPSSVCSSVTYGAWELSSLDSLVGGAADGKTRWRTDFNGRRNIEVSLFGNIFYLPSKSIDDLSIRKFVTVLHQHNHLIMSAAI